ncbi:hypothetical protein, partial [Roseibium sp. RKSG952]|uniref:hypothetical protein n=1 Tax=Roseibium sp. RKSG952 TaxID=2529384 RepID=UPI0018AD10EC
SSLSVSYDPPTWKKASDDIGAGKLPDVDVKIGGSAKFAGWGASGEVSYNPAEHIAGFKGSVDAGGISNEASIDTETKELDQSTSIKTETSAQLKAGVASIGVKTTTELGAFTNGRGAEYGLKSIFEIKTPVGDLKIVGNFLRENDAISSNDEKKSSPEAQNPSNSNDGSEPPSDPDGVSGLDFRDQATNFDPRATSTHSPGLTHPNQAPSARLCRWHIAHQHQLA